MKKRGFTLIELLVTMAIISVLAAIGLSSYAFSQKRARDARRMADLEAVRSALEIYRADNPATGYPSVGTYAALCPSSSDPVCRSGDPLYNYLSQLPLDPKNISPYFYSYSGGGNTYNLCATREVLIPLSYCLTPP